MKNKVILPLAKIPPDVVETYWQTLYMEDTLRFRLCDVTDPTFTDVKELIRRCFSQMYMVLDTETKQAEGEFLLENFTGRAAQIHFSMHPKSSLRNSIDICQWVGDRILYEWTHPEGGPYLQSLFGLTPVTNRVACIFVQKCGLKKIGILPGGMKDRGNIVDAMITVKSRKEPQEPK